MLDEGLTQREIAKKLKVSEQTICNWKNRDENFKDELNKQIWNSFESLVPKAIHTLNMLLSSKNDGVKLGAARDILDRCGFKPIENQNINLNTPNIIFDIPKNDE